jgi:hypothetical protein
LIVTTPDGRLVRDVLEHQITLEFKTERDNCDPGVVGKPGNLGDKALRPCLLHFFSYP